MKLVRTTDIGEIDAPMAANPKASKGSPLLKYAGYANANKVPISIKQQRDANRDNADPLYKFVGGTHEFRPHFYETTKREPTVPPEGSRSTFFTGLSTMSYKSIQSLERKPHLEQYFSVRVDPPLVTISDYEPGSEHCCTLSIKNYSKTVQHISLSTTQTRLFQLAKDVPMGDILISPGLEKEVKVIFRAPPLGGALGNSSSDASKGSSVNAKAAPGLKIARGGSSGHDKAPSLVAAAADAATPAASVKSSFDGSKPSSDPSLRLYMDRVVIAVRGSESIVVPLEAYPAGPQLEFDGAVDFGTLVLSRNAASQLKALHATSESPEEKRSKFIRDKGWAGKPLKTTNDLDVDCPALDQLPDWTVRYVEVRNVGKRVASVRCSYDRLLQIRVTPQAFTLGPQDASVEESEHPSTCRIKIEYLPAVAGQFSGDVKIELRNELPSLKTKRDPHGNHHGMHLSITANVVQHKLRLRNANGNHDLDPRHLHFGVIYYGQRASLPVRIENRSSKPLKWAINHAGESAPVVPGSKYLRANHSGYASLAEENAENRTAVGIHPTEGVLEPQTSSMIHFSFSPQKPQLMYGFKTNQPVAPDKTYQVPMQLKIEGGQDVAGEEPIDIMLTGRACELQAALSTDKLSFPTVYESGTTALQVRLTNSSDQLGFRFKFPKIAQFSFTPPAGRLGPLQSVTVDVVFRPRQLGNFNETTHCEIFPSDFGPDFLEAADMVCASERICDKSVVEQIPLGLIASCAPAVHPAQSHAAKSSGNSAVVTAASPGQSAAGTAAIVLQSGGGPSSSAATGGAGMVPGWAGNGGIPHMGVAVAKAGAIQDRVRFAVLQRSKPVLPAHGLATATVNPEWETKNAHRHMYIDYIRSSRASRLKLKRDHYFQNDGVMVDLRHLVKHDDLSHIDPENGLAPPEPDDCLFLIKPYRADGESGSVESIATAKKVMMSKLLQKQLSSQLVESDQRKLQMQFEKLSEPVVHRPKPAGGFDLFAKLPMPATPPPIVPPEAALTATDLANVYAAVSEIDLGDITIHSTTRVPLNFLNATPSKVPVHLSIQLHEKRADGPERKFHLGVTPSQQVIPTMTVLGFEVSYCNHVLGKFEGRLTYIINGRYRYQIPIHANVIPVALELSQSRMDLEVDISASTRFGPVRDDDVERPGTAQSDMVLGHSHTEYSGQAELHSHSQGQGHGQHDHGGEGRKLSQDLPVAEKYVTVYNNGMSDAMFEWIDNASSGTTGAGTGGQHVHNKHEKHHHNLFFSSLDHIEGRISIEPRQAIVPSKSYMRLKVTYTPGLKPTFDRTVVLNVIDCYNNERVIAGRMELACHGEISAANCVLLTSTKQGPLDLGIIPISLSETNSRAPSVVSGVSSSHAGRGGADGCASSVPGGSNPTPVSNSTMNTSIVSPAPTSVGGPVSIAQAIAGTAGGNGSAAPSSSSAARIQFLNTVFTHAQTSISKVYSGKTAPKGSRTIKIKNASLTACLFMASIVSKTPEVQITPQMGMIAGGGNGVLELQVTASPTRVGVFDDMVIVSIVGGAKTFRIPIQYEGREADIQFSVLGGEMGGGAIIGSQSCQRFQLSNHAWVYGRAVMDLREHPEFSLRVVGLVDLQQQLQQQFQQQQQMGGLDQSQVPPSHLHDKSASALHHHHTIANVASTNGGGGLASRPKTQSTIPSARSRKLDSRSNPIEATNASTRMKVIRPHHELYNIDKEARSKGGFCYVLDCMPMEGVVFELIFQPRAAAKHVLDIPVHILGMSHSEYCMQIDTEGLPSPVVLSKTGVSFKNKVVYRSVGSTAVSHLSPVSKETLTFTNTMHGPMNWRVEMPQPEYGGDVFSLEPVQGTLAGEQTQSLIVTFQPDRPGIFETNATLSISYFDLHADFGISVQGSSVEPSLAFDPPEVFMPIVPLGEETMAIFSIINYGCERTEVKPVIPPDTENLEGSIELFFPEGKLLKSEGERLTVVVRFVPNAVKTPTGKLNPSVSFTTRIQFGESAKRQFFLPVHCTTDCSPLTLQPYLWMTRRECVYELRDRQGVFYERNTLLPKVDENQRRLRILNGPRPFKSPTGIPLDGSIPLQDIEHFWTRIGDTLMPWFDDHLGSTVTWKSFPSAFIASNGRLLIDFIQSLACKKINGISTSLGLVSQADEHAKHVLRQYADILTHLASIGALLSSVKPEFLLSLDDYKRITHKKFEAMKSEVGTSMHDQFLEYTTRIESNFAVISKEAWATVVLQILRVYVMPIATVRHFKHLPGVNKDEADLEWPAAKTNVYSTHENILLKWCGYHLWKRTGIKRRIKSFTDLNDSVLLANLLLSHIPSLKDSHFANFHTNPSTNDQRTFNAASLIKAFKDIYGSNYISTLAPEQLCADNQIEMIMVLVFLYQTLPHFLPVTTVEFCGALHEKVTQTIELTNPSNRPLTYTAELIGHPEYTLAESTFLLPPKSSIQVPVAFVSRFSRPVSAILRLKTKKMGINVSSILVFSLVSVVEAAAPSKVIRVDAPMYSLPPAQINVDVSNPFSRRGTFTIQLRQKRKLNPGGSEEKNLSKQTESFSPPAFRISQEEITIEPGQTSTLTVNFLPFDFGQHECILYFYDDQVGEFMYKIDGKATIPQAIDKFVWTCQSSSSLDKPLRIMPTNPHRDKAIHASLSSSAFQRATTAGANPSSNAAANATNSNKKSKDLKLSSISAMEREAYQLPRKPLRYKVEYSSPFFRGPAEIVVKPAVEGRDKTLMIEQSCTELPISFNPKLPGKYMCKVMLNCIDASDVRVYAIHGNARADGSKAELEFQIPARQSIVQDIPIINRTDEDWTIKATLQGQFFSCPYSMTAKAQSVTHYPIVFKPTKACEVSGLLSLANMQTTQRYTYFLRGCGQEPLPEDTCEVECQARDIVQETFVVRNVSDDDADFGVETDLPFVQSSLAKPIRVSAGGTAECVIKFQPKVSGSSTKCVKFVNRTDGSFVWYTVQLKVHRPPPQQVIPVASAVRKAVSVDIGLANPLQKSVEYRVFIEGKALQGEGLVRLGALEETVYSLVYAPLIQAKETGRIGFVCDEVGEFWYELKLEASDSPPIDLPDMSCPIGKCCSQPLSLENPLEQPITLSISISNARDFQIVLSPTALSSHPPPRQQTPVTKLSLRPLESTQVQLVFWPSSLTEVRKTKIEVTNPQLGNTVFQAKGTGLLPEPMETTQIVSQLNQTVSGLLVFTNPLIDPIPVAVSMQQSPTDSPSSPASGGNFTLLMNRRTRLNIAGLEKLEIPYTYTPTSMCKAEASVMVEMNAQLKWIFPIRGVPERILSSQPQVLDCRSREILERDLSLRLDGFGIDDAMASIHGTDLAHASLFSLDLEPGSGAGPDDLDVSKVLRVAVRECQSLPDGQGIQVGLSVVYSPTRPLDVHVQLVFTHMASGGRWRFPVRLVAQPPSIDDIIVIEGSINKLSMVSFTLHNGSPREKKFRAYFTKDSPSEFTVTPQRGYLVPDAIKKETDNVFVVGYKPLSYGKTLVGTLIVEGEDISSSYEVRGVPPFYQQPVGQRFGASLNSSGSRQMLRSAVIPTKALPPAAQTSAPAVPRGKRNYVLENALPVLPSLTSSTAAATANAAV